MSMATRTVAVRARGTKEHPTLKLYTRTIRTLVNFRFHRRLSLLQYEFLCAQLGSAMWTAGGVDDIRAVRRAIAEAVCR